MKIRSWLRLEERKKKDMVPVSHPAAIQALVSSDASSISKVQRCKGAKKHEQRKGYDNDRLKAAS